MTEDLVTVYVDHHQFNLVDGAFDGPWGEWENENWAMDKFGTNPGLVTVFTERAAGLVPVFVETFKKRPDIQINRWCHIVECPLELKSGLLIVAGEDNWLVNEFNVGRKAFDLEPGSYRVLVLYGAIDSSRYDYQDGADYYSVKIWPCDSTISKVLKRGRGADPLPILTPQADHALSELKELLLDPHLNNKCFAAVQLCRTGKKEAVDLLEQALSAKGTPVVVKRIITSALALARPPQIELLAKRLVDEDVGIRIRALEAFGVLLDFDESSKGELDIDWKSLKPRIHSLSEDKFVRDEVEYLLELIDEFCK
jgi:hypothetical protein